MSRTFNRFGLSAVGAAAALLIATGSAPARPAHVPFKSRGSGTESSMSASGCQNTGTGDCIVQSTGRAISSHMGRGKFVSTLTIHWGSATLNGQGGFCAPADGNGTITAANGATLAQTETGTVCEVGPTSLTAPHTFTGTFTDAGGTGRFASATGTGTIAGSDDGLGHSRYQEAGRISY